MNDLYYILAYWLEPLSSPLYLLGLTVILYVLSKLTTSTWKRVLPLFAYSLIFWGAYRLAALNPAAAKWLYRLNLPFISVFVVLVMPAIFLSRNRWYKYFLLIPAGCIVLMICEVFYQYRMAPSGSGFFWFPMRSGFMFAGLIGALVIVQNFLSLEYFRKVVRVSVFLVLIYGGFALRQNYLDYQQAISRQKEFKTGILKLTETVPVMKHDNRLSYVPGAPCRFSADGGYVQGCVMELGQRFLQLDWSKVASGDPSFTALFSMALGAMLTLIILAYTGARWWCGWICPLATLGDVFDFFRRKLGMPYLKPTRTVKLTYLISGISFAFFGLLLSKAYANIGPDGKFIGCRIPLYPFCKICPGQQVCPIASKGPGEYTPLPGFEWLFGFFTVSVIVLMAVFLFGFITARRLWCRFCPMGMFGGIFNRGGMLALKKNVSKCNGCGACNEVCPMDIHLVQEEMVKKDVSSFDCLYCLKCVDNCPQDKCLRFEFAGQVLAETDYTAKLKKQAEKNG